MALAYYGIRQRVVQGFQCENAAISLHSGPFFKFFCPNDVKMQYLLVPFYALYSKTIVFNQIIGFKEENDKKSPQALIFFGRAICRRLSQASLLIFPPPPHALFRGAARLQAARAENEKKDPRGISSFPPFLSVFAPPLRCVDAGDPCQIFQT